jgi:hypothetical protein
MSDELFAYIAFVFVLFLLVSALTVVAQVVPSVQ